MSDRWTAGSLGDYLELDIEQVDVRPGHVYPIVGVLNGGRGLLTRPPVSSDDTNYPRLTRATAGKVIYRKLTAYEGAITVVPGDLGEAYVSPEFPTFKCGQGLLPAYARLMTQDSRLWQGMAIACKGVGGRRERLHPRDFLSIPVRVPSVPEQGRIVDLIDASDEAYETTEKVRFRASTDLYEAVLADLGMRYESRRIGEVVVTARSGGTPSRQRADFYGGGIPWLKSGEVEQDAIDCAEETITEAGLAASSAWMVPPGSTLVAMYGQGDTKGRVGYVARSVATNQAVLALVPDVERIHSRFLLHAVRSRTQSLRKRATGSVQPNLSKTLILSEPIPLPPLSEQVSISDALDSLVRERNAAQALALALRKQRFELLMTLLSGEHRIHESYDDLIGR